ncbi:MAG: DUF4424 family protein [Pseudotabrizicola sp.]|uniref:DUF4424 family protein n=1 Tax=Pseudotabrizicola sp. TaxID=2939647 RepID=UPI0027304796|nr:DUF4424 family protein [Pseudotabrizicola sp.]MDP2081886.1 DUF4424 family protein [Pseudotabrizicola sp.]MDZ7575958.1 DUF4424 family protein [Pseudotabrizicola sp.]
MRFAGVLTVGLGLTWAPVAQANDGFGGLTATGLTFGQTDAIAMEEEDLVISRDEVRVDYVFRNLTGQDVTGEVIFPLPPISLSLLLNSEFNLPDDPSHPDLVNFRAVVDGADVAVSIDRIAVLEPPWEEDRPQAEQYDTPGPDVTAALQRYGMPMTPDVDAVLVALYALNAVQLRNMVNDGLLESFNDGPDLSAEDVMPLWSIVARYHWTQTFPAGEVLRISHSYDNRPPGGIFVWQDPPKAEWLSGLRAQYCIDAATSRGIAKQLAASEYDGMVTGLSWHISYVLRTANSWAGPIGRFRLTVDKGDAGHILSLCANGVKKTGPTTFEVEWRDYTPTSDLEILIVAPLEG